MTAIDQLTEAAKAHPMYAHVRKTNGKIVIGKGEFAKPDYLFIGEAPGQEENISGKPFVGRSGKILDEWIERAGIKKYAVINAVPMMPANQDGSIRTPTREEIDYFRPYTKSLINEINPTRLIYVGKSAAKFLELEKEFKNKQWVGKTGFIYHPSYYLRNGVRGTDDFIELIKNAAGPKTAPAAPERTPASKHEKKEMPAKKQKGLGEFI